ncbi:hypothetical protein OE09_1088 [Flavobacteriaceae bacterium MAR_2010_72]|nr:hypothetical protein OE09_1088 [Flavobacteriaceae bacterium MAR_2010_72]TVZ60111.1 hypothetical protein NA63_2661 [Flavobacteriaceae bacterium MAR_2010_105]
MNKNTEYFGIDISKGAFDVYGLELGHHQFANNEKGFKQFIKKLLVSLLQLFYPLNDLVLRL